MEALSPMKGTNYVWYYATILLGVEQNPVRSTMVMMIHNTNAMDWGNW